MLTATIRLVEEATKNDCQIIITKVDKKMTWKYEAKGENNGRLFLGAFEGVCQLIPSRSFYKWLFFFFKKDDEPRFLQLSGVRKDIMKVWCIADSGEMKFYRDSGAFVKGTWELVAVPCM